MADEHGSRVLLVTAWHFPSMRAMPRAFWRIRTLDRASRGTPFLLWLHRWVSRRSVALTMSWADAAAARAWLNSQTYRAAARDLERLGGQLHLEVAGGDASPGAARE